MGTKPRTQYPAPYDAYKDSFADTIIIITVMRFFLVLLRFASVSILLDAFDAIVLVARQRLPHAVQQKCCSIRKRAGPCHFA